MASESIPSSGTAASAPWITTVLWIAWAGMLLGGFIVGPLDESGTTRIALWQRMGSSLTLVVAGAVFAITSSGTSISVFATCVAIGMALGFIGDLSNADLLPISNPILGGIVAFGIGHVFYIAGQLAVRAPCRLNDQRTLLVAIALWLAIGAVAWFFVVYLSPKQSILNIAALPYSLLLAGTTGCATGLALQDRRFTGLALGAALFLFSDLVLAWRIFRGPFPHAGDLVWLTYGPGQMLIVYSIVAARKIARVAT